MLRQLFSSAEVSSHASSSVNISQNNSLSHLNQPVTKSIIIMAAPITNIMGAERNVECCEIEASVNTGFEEVAKDEVAEKFGVIATTARGKINFSMPISDAKKVNRSGYMGDNMNM